MAHLIDTSVFGRLANTTDQQYTIAVRAVRELRRRGEDLCITAQSLIEFRSMATRPLALNGLGMPPADVELAAADFEAEFPLVPDSPAIFPAWKAIVQALGVIGKQVHHARLVAVCLVHGITHLLTFNVGHFSRLVGFGPAVTVVDPATV